MTKILLAQYIDEIDQRYAQWNGAILRQLSLFHRVTVSKPPVSATPARCANRL